jgi:hypothetical protein
VTWFARTAWTGKGYKNRPLWHSLKDRKGTEEYPNNKTTLVAACGYEFRFILEQPRVVDDQPKTKAIVCQRCVARLAKGEAEKPIALKGGIQSIDIYGVNDTGASWTSFDEYVNRG